MNIIKTTPEVKIVKGVEVLKIKPGTFLKHVGGSDILIKTNISTFPLINLLDGEAWGNHLGGYEFEIITSKMIVDPNN